MSLTVLSARDSAPWEAGRIIEAPAVEEQSDAQLIASVLAGGEPTRMARRQAAALLDAGGGLASLLHSPASMLEEYGLSPSEVRLLGAALALGARAATSRLEGAPLDGAAVADLFRPLLAHLAHEEMHLVLLDARGRYRGRRRLASGGMASCSLYARDVLAPVLEAKAPAFALVHNHPSGVSTPSPEDVSLSTRVLAAAEVVGARLIDHLVIADDGHASAMPDGARWPIARARVRQL